MRLVFLGNAFEMEECVRECLASQRRTDAYRRSYDFGGGAGRVARLRSDEGCGEEGDRYLGGRHLDKWTESERPTDREKDTKRNMVNALGTTLGP